MQYTSLTTTLAIRFVYIRFSTNNAVILLTITRICYVFTYLFKYACRVIFFLFFSIFEKYEKLFRLDKFRLDIGIYIY